MTDSTSKNETKMVKFFLTRNTNTIATSRRLDLEAAQNESDVLNDGHFIDEMEWIKKKAKLNKSLEKDLSKMDF